VETVSDLKRIVARRGWDLPVPSCHPGHTRHFISCAS
jgi:hypothetical protein